MAETKPIVSDDVASKFWAKISVREPDKCWFWRGKRERDGYGITRLARNISTLAHRVAFAIANNRAPTGIVRHSCDNPRCCNPGHLIEGTVADNVRDRVMRGRSAFGERNGRAKLNESQVSEILTSDLRQFHLARKFEVDDTTIRDIRNGKNWRHVAARFCDTSMAQ